MPETPAGKCLLLHQAPSKLILYSSYSRAQHAGSGPADTARADHGSPHSPFLISVRFHWPMQGPQALASTVPPAFWKISSMPSRSMVALQPREACLISNVVVTLCH